jgi:cholesterol oxidase
MTYPLHGAAFLNHLQPDNNDTDADSETRQALLLIHGLAHGSRIFWTDTISDDHNRENMVQYFLRKNYDVWIVDHRTSPNFIVDLDPQDRWDYIAQVDIPWAVNHIFTAINQGNTATRKKVHVFSHCIGAGAVSMAVLNGNLNFTNSDGNPESMLASLVPHAVAPWLFASMANRTRSNLWALAKDLELLDVVEPCPHQETPLIETLLDRIATSSLMDYENAQWDYSSIKDDPRGPMFPRTIYTRYTIIWGRQWVNENINRETRNQFAGMIGATPRDVLQQVYTSVTRGLLSNHNGNNIYVTEDNIKEQWTFPTLFIHGDKNTVFDIETSRKSAEMLTRHRKAESDPPSFLNNIEPQDYCDNKVWIEVLEGYGHMDMILGDNAFQNDAVYPKLHRFFQTAAKSEADDSFSEEYEQDIQTQTQKDAFNNLRRARSHIGPIKRPLTGPIISNPVIEDDIATGTRTLKLNIWVEAQDFSSIEANSVFITGAWEPEVRVLFALAPPEPSGPMTLAPLKAPAIEPPSNSPKFINSFEPLPFTGRSKYNSDDNDLNPFPFSSVEDIFWLIKGTFTVGQNRSMLFSTSGATNTGSVTNLEMVRYLWVDYAWAVYPIDSDPPSTAVELRWEGLDWLQRLILPDPVDSQDPDLCFIVGSCLYPGVSFDYEQMSGIFDGIYAHVERYIPDPQVPEVYRRGVDHLMLIGDQIYADATADILDPVSAYEKYRDRYRRAWSSPPARRLFSHVPTYFAVDDHEYDDNYQGEISGLGDGSAADDEKLLAEFYYARNMAWQFHMHDDVSWNSETPQLWQNFNSAGIPFFVFDTRFERTPDNRSTSSSLVNDEQLAGFDNWLDNEAQQSSVIFIASGSPMAPVTKAQQKEPYLLEGGDSLLSYPGFLDSIIEKLAQKVPDKHICWLTGDPHISCYAKLTFNNGTHTVNLTQVCSSGVYAPLSFINMNKNACVWGAGVESLDLGNNLVLDYEQFLLTDHHQHFVRVDLEGTQTASPSIRLSAYDAASNPILIPAGASPATYVQVMI